jgi:hypothetical protein
MKTTIELAREAGWDAHHAEFDTRIDRLVALVRADERSVEREACAILAEKEAQYTVAATIRNRGNT